MEEEGRKKVPKSPVSTLPQKEASSSESSPEKAQTGEELAGLLRSMATGERSLVPESGIAAEFPFPPPAASSSPVERPRPDMQAVLESQEHLMHFLHDIKLGKRRVVPVEMPTAPDPFPTSRDMGGVLRSLGALRKEHPYTSVLLCLGEPADSDDIATLFTGFLARWAVDGQRVQAVVTAAHCLVDLKNAYCVLGCEDYENLPSRPISDYFTVNMGTLYMPADYSRPASGDSMERFLEAATKDYAAMYAFNAASGEDTLFSGCRPLDVGTERQVYLADSCRQVGYHGHYQAKTATLPAFNDRKASYDDGIVVVEDDLLVKGGAVPRGMSGGPWLFGESVGGRVVYKDLAFGISSTTSPSSDRSWSPRMTQEKWDALFRSQLR